MKSVLFILHDGFALNSLSNMTDILYVAGWLSEQKLYDWAYAARTGKAATAYNGAKIEAAPIRQFEPIGWDYVVVVTSFDPHSLAADEAILGFLRQAHRRGAKICGVETGGVTLAAAGLLDGGDAAIHWANREGLSEVYPDIRLSSEDIVFYRRCITCVGGTATFDLALHMVEKDYGGTLALEVAEHLCNAERYLEKRRRFLETIAGISGNRTLDRAIRTMNDHIEDPLNCIEIADRAGASQRQLERVFKRQLGLTPKAHYLALRLTRAQNLLQQTRLSIHEIAASTGFQSMAHFSRAYKSRFGVPPRADRVQSQTASVPRLFIDRSRLDEA